ncbi:predicted protein [Plenodomus lingam JN3]|uniref:Uncharacterized protein n=1 Tax=Leptosphaeria maculans (strain JN3 / isolate v23.1.3 / race Av1-4-5-6-7-8) TaxID=985895 RepID=E5A762_LEPMJ|nr:predicted protein [Plenodomus lingam JN3]CBX99457.1 predicted protein [Plenodomus lingam JN3]
MDEPKYCRAVPILGAKRVEELFRGGGISREWTCLTLLTGTSPFRKQLGFMRL